MCLWLTQRLSHDPVWKTTTSVIAGISLAAIGGWFLEVLLIVGVFAVDLISGKFIHHWPPRVNYEHERACLKVAHRGGIPEPAGFSRQEFKDGELIELPPAKYLHSELVKRIAKLLETMVHESRVWSETGFQLRAGRWIVPDLRHLA